MIVKEAMQTMEKYYENPAILHVGTMDNRAYYIPFASRQAALEGNGDQSERRLLLSGIWQFRYYSSVLDVPETFWLQDGLCPVSYTHLDVYKRQEAYRSEEEWRRQMLKRAREGDEEALEELKADSLAMEEDILERLEEEDIYSCLLYTSRCV